MVSGPGHDFLNRHSCSEGVFIRTILMKNVSYNLNETNKFNSSAGYIKFGAGIVFSEAHFHAG
jgi:hypothetical protein